MRELVADEYVCKPSSYSHLVKKQHSSHYQFQADNLIRWVWGTSYKSLYHETKNCEPLFYTRNIKFIVWIKPKRDPPSKDVMRDKHQADVFWPNSPLLSEPLWQLRGKKTQANSSGLWAKCRPNGYDEHMPPCHTMAAYYYRAVCITTQLITVDSCGFCRWWKQELHNSIEWLHPLP